MYSFKQLKDLIYQIQNRTDEQLLTGSDGKITLKTLLENNNLLAKGIPYISIESNEYTPINNTNVSQTTIVNYKKLNEYRIRNRQKALNISELMGYEGSISALYWDSLRLVIEVPFEKRVTFGAKDIVNSSLNYAYAILYGRIQHYLVHAGLSLNISFLHSIDGNKPTLTFDMIEEFRTFIVDRTIFSMLNKNEPIKLDNDGLLTKSSRQLISKNIKEKLGSYT